MKKYVAMLFALLLILLLVFGLTTCSSKNVPAEPDISGSAEVETADRSSDEGATTEPDISTPTPDVPGGNETAGNTPGGNTTDGKTTDTPGGNTSGDNKTGSNDKNHTHSYSSKVVAATCTADGYTLHTCSSCGDYYTDSPTKALGHNYKDKVVKPTATAQGFTEHTCSRCGYSYRDNYTAVIPSHTHNYTVTNTVAATCSSAGKTTYTCSCGDSYTTTQNALGHSWKEMYEDVPKYEAVDRSICSACGADISGNTYEHCEAHALKGENAGYYSRTDQVQVGTESQFVGYKCTRCGEWK